VTFINILCDGLQFSTIR